MELYCEKCNNPVSDNDKFCPHCGATVVAGSPNKKTTIHCPECNHENPEVSAFCEKCGASLTETKSSKNQKAGPQTFTSTGTYSGKMIKGKTPGGWKIFRNVIIGIILLGIIALVVWFQVDPEAGKKLTDVLTGIGFMIVFFFLGWLFMRGKKRKKSGWDDDQYADVNDNDFDSDGDDDD